ncbi:hypothetical protein SALBM217S_10868 [Streptomyces griseoloalbus]
MPCGRRGGRRCPSSPARPPPTTARWPSTESAGPAERSAAPWRSPGRVHGRRPPAGAAGHATRRRDPGRACPAPASLTCSAPDLAHLAQPGQIVGGDGFLQPDDAEVGQGGCHADGLLAGVAAVRVDVQLGGVAHGTAGQHGAVQVAGLPAAPGLGDLDLHAADALLGPAAPAALRAGCRRRWSGPPLPYTATSFAGRAQQTATSRQVQQARFEVPQGGVDGGYGPGADAGPAPCYAERGSSGRPRPGRRRRRARRRGPPAPA